MPSPSPHRSMEDLERLQQLKGNFERLKQTREDFLSSIEKFSKEEEYLHEVSVEREDLEREKMILTEEMKGVNNDINKLDAAVKLSEHAKKSAYESATNYLKAMREAYVKVNTDRIALQLEPLPDSVVDHELYERFQYGSMVPHHWNMPNMNMFQMQPGPPIGDDFHHRSAAELAMLANVSVNAAVAANAASLDASASASSSTSTFGKQQPPPMKICNSCQQQIHRNAPICPLCKAKSRSRNPKKPKRKIEDPSQ